MALLNSSPAEIFSVRNRSNRKLLLVFLSQALRNKVSPGVRQLTCISDNPFPPESPSHAIKLFGKHGLSGSVSYNASSTSPAGTVDSA